MLMASQQVVSRNADGIAAGWLAEMLMASQHVVSRNADGIAAGGYPKC